MGRRRVYVRWGVNAVYKVALVHIFYNIPYIEMDYDGLRQDIIYI